MGMIIIPCLFVVALMAILIIILAVKACNSEKSENRLSFLCRNHFSWHHCCGSWMVAI
ncbi:Uncharacterised protein [Salmonella enterica subsp. enterica]|nr:Uncharacterised protein [Salmonella enterica subsp. enterica]